MNSVIQLTLAAIAWEPTIRGILAVVIGVVALVGSVYLLVATNSGARTGFLISITGLFGWMAIMGLVWWIYGIGWVGNDPHWREVEIARNGPESAHIEVVAEDPSLGKWSPVPESDPAFGELQAVASDELISGNPPAYTSPDDYIILEVWQRGGKPKRSSDSMVDRVSNKIGNTLRLTHPKHYAVVEVQGVIDQGPTQPGQAPPRPEVDPDAPVVMLVLERDLGNLRLRPAALTIFSTIVFGIGANALHRRDKMEAENRARKEPLAV